MPYCKVGEENGQEIRIYFEDHGDGAPVVLIHGFPFSGTAWEKQEIALLDAGHRVITYDRRGFGRSSRPAIGYDWNTFAADLEALLTELELRDVALVGHSMGTGEITRYLANHGSGRIRQAVFVSPLPPFLLKTDENLDGVEKKVFEGFKEAILKDRPAFITEFLKSFYNLGVFSSSAVSEEKLRVDFTLAASASPTATYQCIDTWTEDFRDNLAKIDIPSLIIQGDADKVLPFAATGERLAKAIDAQLVKIDGGPHGIPWTHATEVNAALLLFLGESSTVRAPKEIDRSASANLH